MATTFVVVGRDRHTFVPTAGFLSPSTVRNRLSAVFRTLRVSSQRELGVVTLDDGPSGAAGRAFLAGYLRQCRGGPHDLPESSTRVSSR